MRLICLISVLFLLFLPEIALAQNTITFDDMGWNTDQSLDSNFTTGNFLFSSNKNFYTNYGYNFDVYNVSIYFAFENPAMDQFTINSITNESYNLISLAAYQVSESSTDTLIIEGWNGSDKKYTNAFLGISNWQVLDLNYENINKVVFRLKPSGNGSLSDYNFDNFSFNSTTVPVELVEFKATSQENNIKLEWQTATELNNFGFDIERQMTNDPMTNDGDSHSSMVNGQWTKIGFVKGNGTTTDTKSYSFTDNTVINGNKYKYRLKQIDQNGSYKYSSETEVTANLVPTSYSLSQNYPNPFNPSTTINFVIPKSSFVNLKVFDILGNEVATLVDENKDAGKYKIVYDAQNLASGIYIYKLVADGYISTKKMILLH